MTEKKSNHVFTVNLEGLNLSEDHLQRINSSIQKTVMTELAGLNMSKNQGGLLSRFDHKLRGIWYVENLSRFNIE